MMKTAHLFEVKRRIQIFKQGLTPRLQLQAHTNDNLRHTTISEGGTSVKASNA